MLRELRHGTRRKWRFSATLAVAFGLVDVLAQLAVTEPLSWSGFVWWRALAAPVGAFAAAWLLFSVLDHRAASPRQLPEKRSSSRWQVPVAFCAPLVTWSVQFLHFWPMASMNDTWWILSEPISYATYHPLTYTLSLAVLTHIAEFFGGSVVAGLVLVAVVQMLMWAGVAALSILALRRLGTRPLALWLLVAYFALMPIVGNYAFAIVKDAVFSIFVVLLIPVLLQIRQTRGSVLRVVWFFAAAAAVLIGFAVFRNNGLLAVFLILPLIIIWATRARLRAWVLAVVVVMLALVPLALTNVLAGQQQFQESVGVPLQLYGYANTYDRECIPAESREYFDEIMDPDTWSDLYVSGDVDPVKYSGLINLPHLSNTRAAFIKHWLLTAAACPGTFAAGYLAHSNHLWRFDAANAGETGGQSYFTTIISNQPEKFTELFEAYRELGVENATILPTWLDEPLGMFIEAGLKATPGTGTWLWLMIFTIIGFIYRRRGEWLAVFAPSLIIWLTLLAAAPAVHPFRYVQFIVIVLPISWALLFATPSMDRQTAQQVTDKGRLHSIR